MKTKALAIVIFILINFKIEKYNGQGIQSSSCGRRFVNRQPLISDGWKSKEGDWPWHAAIYHLENQDIKYKCGSSLINSNSILTAAHCVYENNRPIIADRVIVQLGKFNLKLSGSHLQEFEAFKVIVHPNYSTSDFSNDIAIIKLSTEAVFNDYVQPICLWESSKVAISEVEEKLGTVVGWGVTETNTLSYILRQATMPVVSHLTCLESNRDFYGGFLSHKNFCAGFRNGTTVCKGDSGGSIVFEENGVYHIRGIVSLAVGNLDEESCNSDHYVIFTDVAKYLTWIDGVAQQIISSRSKLGAQCLTSTSEPGICTGLPDCPELVNDVVHGKWNHVVCGYDGNAQIVCCPSAQATTSTAQAKTTTTLASARISVRKCNEYKEFAYNKIEVSYVLGQPPMEKKVSNCASPVPLIVGGIHAHPREFPHMALIGFRDGNSIKWDCGGTLISEQFVLTVARCTMASRKNNPPSYVRLGDHDLDRTDDASPILLNIVEWIPHPEYKFPIYYNDIGLLKMESAVQFNSAIRPACLPSESAVQTKRAIATGWGTVAWGGNRSNILLKVVLDIFSNSDCNNSYGTYINRGLNRGVVEETQVCAGSHQDKKDSCQGDSGGPLQIYHETHFCTYTIVGVTSFGKSCGTIGVPSIYTRVYAYLKWIEDTVWPRGDDFDVSQRVEDSEPIYFQN